MTAIDICKSCKDYREGEGVCENGFPIPYAQDVPMCMRGDYSHRQMARFFDESGYPLFVKGGQ